MSVIRIGTTTDSVSQARARAVAAALAATAQAECEVVTDEFTAQQLRDALIGGEIDVIVSSASEPSEPDPRLITAAYLKRTDSRDALCARDGLIFDTLPAGALVAVSGARRAAQVRARRPDLECEIVSGDADELLARLAEGGADAVVIAAADLDRLRRLDAITEYLGNDGWPTTPGQGSTALVVRAEAEKGAFGKSIRSLNHGPTRTIVEAEAGIRERLGAAGELLGAHGIIDDGLIFVSARVYRPDGADKVTSSHALYVADVPHPARDIADRVAAELRSLGADGIAAGTAMAPITAVDSE
jgi:hydroxymethylbilane synthase